MFSAFLRSLLLLCPGSVYKDRTSDGKVWRQAESVYEFTVNDLRGNPVHMEEYRGYVLLVVNVASRCGLAAKNYAQMVDMDEKYREHGLRILAFPCNQFGQEPGTPEQIYAFAKEKGANFDFFEKVDVNGPTAHPLWKYLKMKKPGTGGEAIKWNFTKFLVNRQGQPVGRYAPIREPKEIIEKIEALL